MSTIQTSCPALRSVIGALDQAVSEPDLDRRCHLVKDILEGAFKDGLEFLSPEWTAPAPNCYARRLLHKDPEGRYSVVVMVWGVGQGTALHDHDGEWCVECVYSGRIRVTSYDYFGEVNNLHQFKQEKEIFAGRGEAGALIPPFEYHVLANALDEPSVTVHVYGHELQECGIFLPVDGGYERQTRTLCYTSD